MSTSSDKPLKIFGLNEANAMLPLVKAIVVDLHRLHSALSARQRDLDVMTKSGELKAGAIYDEEVEETRSDLLHEFEKLGGYVDELSALGVVLTSVDQGLVEFPARRGQRLIYLSWKLGESEVGHWRRDSEDFEDRRPVPVSFFSLTGNNDSN